MQKIVFNGHYLTYIDTAIAEYWREIGLPYPHGYVERYANDVYLRKASVEYLGSARYDDVLEICCRVARLGRSSMKAAPLPEELRGRVRRYERVAPQS